MAVAGLVLVVLMVAFSGCGPKGSGSEAGSECNPTDLRLDVNNHSMTVIWETSCDHTISGYNIYLSDRPLSARDSRAEVQPFNRVVFPGDTEPGDGVEHFKAELLDNGIDYFVSVCTVFPDGSLSRSSNEVHTICGPRGEFDLPIRYKRENDGFSFDSSRSVSADASSNDIYFYSKNGVDYLCSPVRLNGFLRDNKLGKMQPKGSFDEAFLTALRVIGPPDSTRVEVELGDWIWIRTIDDATTLLSVAGFTGHGPNRRISLKYAHFPAFEQR